MRMNWIKERIFTLFCCIALARYCAPRSRIIFPLRLSVSNVYKKKLTRSLQRYNIQIFITLFRLSELARYFAPSEVISLWESFNVVNVCEENREYIYISMKSKIVTLLCCKTSAKYCTPASLILFSDRSSVTSVY